MSEETSSDSQDLLVIGPGVLGTRVAQLWKSKHPQSKVFLKARNVPKKRQEKWTSNGYQNVDDFPDKKFDQVVFSAPPSGKLLFFSVKS